jgi:hypothetical protein
VLFRKCAVNLLRSGDLWGSGFASDLISLILIFSVGHQTSIYLWWKWCCRIRSYLMFFCLGICIEFEQVATVFVSDVSVEYWRVLWSGGDSFCNDGGVYWLTSCQMVAIGHAKKFRHYFLCHLCSRFFSLASSNTMSIQLFMSKHQFTPPRKSCLLTLRPTNSIKFSPLPPVT